MIKEKVVIWGASGHAKVVTDIIRLNNKYEIVGFLDDQSPDRKGEHFCGSTVLGGVEQFDKLLKENINKIILGFGNCTAREELSKMVLKKGFELINAIHPKSIISPDTKLGNGVVVCAGAIINPGVAIGNNVIVNTGSSIDHNCSIADSVHICPGVHLAGDVTIGKCSWVGIGSIIKEKITVNSNVYIGAGSLIIKDIPANVLVYGSPAKIIRPI